MTSFYGKYHEKGIISDEEENSVSRTNVDKWIFRLLLVLIGFMPIVILAHTEEVISPLISDISVLTSGTKGDLFTHYKSLIVLIITIITGILLLAKIFFMNGKIRKTKVNYILGIFVCAIVFSTILSPNITIALNGQYNRSDGAISWLCYIVLMFIAMNINYPKKVINYVMYSLIPFVIVNLFIITNNFYGNDMLKNKIVQDVISIFLVDGTNLSEGSQLVGTLNQWNYMSGMFGIITAMFLVWAMLERKWITSIISIIVTFASVSVLFMSVSRGGFVTLLLIMLLLLFSILRMENKLKAIVVYSLFLLIAAPIFHILAKENPEVWNESFGLFIDSNPYMEEELDGNENVSFTYEYNLINKVYASENSFELPILPEREYAPGSGRFYIWEKTYDLLKERPFFGYGLDTLMYNFPHYNIDARSGLNTEHTITDKPHNLFVGILYGTGIVGFGVFLLIIVTLALLSFKALLIEKCQNNSVLGVAIIAYLLQAMVNDSLPSTSAVIFVFMGIMISLATKTIEREGVND
ncbi:hypothetical protein MTP04_07860 [Lysinibacillus sp. PLM2]|nr:hypothetical protein MTP04_07860 [Lysinibacillus sp. PLM2]